MPDLNPEPAFIRFTDEVNGLLHANGLTVRLLCERLAIHGLKVGTDPAAPAGDKSVAEVMLGAAAVIAAATPIILELIRAIGVRGLVARERRLTVAKDTDGNPLRDADGNPLLLWSETTRVLEDPNRISKSTSTLRGLGFEIAIESSRG